MFSRQEKELLVALIGQLQFPASDEGKEKMELFLSIQKKLSSMEEDNS